MANVKKEDYEMITIKQQAGWILTEIDQKKFPKNIFVYKLTFEPWFFQVL